MKVSEEFAPLSLHKVCVKQGIVFVAGSDWLLKIDIIYLVHAGLLPASLLMLIRNSASHIMTI